MINKRLFGTPISGSVRQKLEARQKVAGDLQFGQSKNGTQMIDGVFPDVDGKVQAYLSSRTPFVRMWTSVKIIEAGEVVDDIDTVIVNTEDEDLLKEYKKGIRAKYGEEYPRLKIKPVKDPFNPNMVLSYIVYNASENRDAVDFVRKVYEIGNHAYQEKYQKVEPNQNNQATTMNQSTDPLDVSGSAALAEILPHQLKTNPLLRPQAGITKVTSETQGVLGVIKKTTVDFKVNNFYDFDRIYTKYFLVPGASLFVDFGWSDVDLYDPEDLIFKDSTQGTYNDIQKFLYSEESSNLGYIVKNQGEVDVIHGVVTDYSSKVNMDGTVDCSVTLTSSNSALLSFKTDDNVVTRIKAILTRGILYLGLREVVDEFGTVGSYPTKDLAELMTSPNYDSPAIDIETYNKNLVLAASKQLSGRTGPENNSIRTGVFVDSLNTDNVYISFGLFEDLIINSQFGFGSNKDNIINGGNLEVKSNSVYSFATFDKLAKEKQHVMLQVPEEAPKVLYPSRWGEMPEEVSVSGGGSAVRGGFGSYSYQNKKFPKEDYEKFTEAEIPEDFKGSASSNTTFANGLRKNYISRFDEYLGRIPIRELFINVDVIVKAFEQNDSVKKVFKQICDELNEDTDNLFDLRVTGGETEAEIKIIDANYSIGTEDKKTKILNEPFFTFNIMSPNSIIKDYNLEFKLPSGDIGNMYAIRGMSHGNTVFSTDKSIDDAVAIGALEKDLLRIVYEPDLGTYTLDNLLEEHNDGEMYNVFKAVDYLFDNNLYNIRTKNRAYMTNTAVQGQLGSTNATPGVFQFPLSQSDTPAPPVAGAEEPEAPTPEDLIKQNDENMTFLGYKVANTFDKYYTYRSVTETRDNRPNLLPYTLTLTTYGISSIQPGDTFQVDYLPKRYIENTYLQTIKVTHNIGTDGWYTTLDTQFRLEGGTKNIVYDTREKNKILLSPTALQNAGFDGKLYIDNNFPIFGWDSEFSISDLAPYMEKVKIEYIPKAKSFDYIILFNTTAKLGEIKDWQENKYELYHTSGNFFSIFKSKDFMNSATAGMSSGKFEDYTSTYVNAGNTRYYKVFPPAVYFNQNHKYAIFVKGSSIAILDREKDSYQKLKTFFTNHPTREETYSDPSLFVANI